VITSLQIEFIRYLGPDGEALAPLPEFARDPAALVPLYRAMVLTRTFDAKAIALQRTGKLGTFASSLGQEAVGVGVASAMSAVLLVSGVSLRVRLEIAASTSSFAPKTRLDSSRNATATARDPSSVKL